ncbi:dynamin family protein [Fictibacillus terranigra]|uniref:Dynamin family protein n=1 Tax=Fictibacillus terranigra TaxID=3058424 RepID=A0ABT8E5U3_9BACL|nr:dynamin family protein [Fictibacillus sp. CENA-BCM004]MDN4073278.1 dynamin family protein [Fictibacillus sp. CENA-BCM004]
MDKARMTETRDQQVSSTAASIAAAYLELTKLGSHTEAEAVLELFEKVKNQQFAIAFCGHFSAGKSSMINELIGENILPSSPIPTSANVVKVQCGNPSARVKMRNKGIIQINPPVNMAEIKRWAKNGEEIESIEINVDQGLLPDRIAIYDTPGIDSTDDAHKIATESALHMADVVFYIMDYNHVLSQLNFTFIRLLKEQGKKVYLIVNQIDKHNEKELSFQAFAEKIKSGFKSWDIEPEEIFFTSIMDRSHNGNELQDIKTLFQKFYLAKDEWIQENALSETERLIRTAVQTHLDHDEDLNRDAFERAEGSDESKEEQKKAHLLVKKETIENEAGQKKADVAKRFKDILDNAILMPFHTRELAKNYIESRQDSFKVGVLFTSKKTEAERNARLQSFFESVQENIKTQISWHLKDYFHAMSAGMKEEPALSTERLAALIKPGASLNGNYVLQYCNDVVEDIKRTFLSHYRPELDQITNVIDRDAEAEVQKYEALIIEQEKLLAAHRKTKEVKQKWHRTERELLDSLYRGDNQADAFAEADHALAAQEAEACLLPADEGEGSRNTGQVTEIQIHEKDLAEETAVNDEKTGDVSTLENQAKKLHSAAAVLSGLEMMKNQADTMKQFSERLLNRDFTVSLFGAFSAGKSSFANALIGEDLLPVSPNPTTATINRIAPPDQDHQHGTALIHFKKEQDLLAEINQSLSHFGKQAESIFEAIQEAGEIDTRKSSDKLRPHLQFLMAVHKGFTSIKHQLGTEMSVSVEEFKAFVADEEKACFTESVTVYYECALTMMGVTLVDTPGADSINARHTNVAFEFIKKSDAILYVTYYNHAFSAADREFLIQLGRVKDTFELDKMFFVINASDLAKGQEELMDVIDHVGGNLRRFGIRHPKLFPMSSYFSLLGQKDRNELSQEELNKLNRKYGELQKDELLQQTGYMSFLTAFMSFLKDDLASVMVNSAINQYEQSKVLLERLINETEASQKDRERRTEELKNMCRLALQKMDSFSLEQKQEMLQKEIHELLFYVKQRVMLRFTEFFNEAFNSSVITGSAKEQKNALPESFKELHQRIQFDLQQESRATVLRIEKFILHLLNEMNEEMDLKLKSLNTPQYLMQNEGIQFKTLEIETKLKEAEGSQSVFKDFKNARHFFEEGGKKSFMDKMYALMENPVETFVNESALTFNGYYESTLKKFAHLEINRRKTETEVYFEGLQKALDTPELLEKMKESLQKLNSL